MRRTKYREDLRTIFSIKLAKYLECMGFMIIEQRPDLRGTGRDVFIFANTPQLRKAIDAYMG